MIEILCR